jgi:hypothetical protein
VKLTDTAAIALGAVTVVGLGVSAYFVFKRDEVAPGVPDDAPPAPDPTSSGTTTAQGYDMGRPVTVTLQDIGGGHRLAPQAAQMFLAMKAAAAAEGLSLVPCSSFRSMEDQQRLWDMYKAGTGNLAAKPGFSNHQTGISVDLNTSSYVSKNYRWLFMNASKYGFKNNVLTEHWHWTYLGGETVQLAGLSGLGSTAMPVGPVLPGVVGPFSNVDMSLALPLALGALVVYQVYVRSDQGAHHIGVR